MKNIILGTAGHVDHGKTELIKALTGIDTDRLPEEKRRGISIELGFAYLNFEDGSRVGVVDVPGHERFVRAMLAGAGGIDLVLLVIAADEGIMPQTKEHLSICELLHIKSGVVAVTKADLVEKDWLEMVVEEIHEFLQDSPFRMAPIIATSAKTGLGLEELRKTLYEQILAVQQKPSEGYFRMPIDRVFTLKGHGTVVTGTIFSGKVQVQEKVEIIPERKTCRVRSIQVHNQSVETAYAGQRTALNLHPLGVEEIARGELVAKPEYLKPSYIIDADLKLLKDCPLELKNRSRVRFHHGTAEVMARLILLDREKIKAGEESSIVQFHLEDPLALVFGDYYVLRRYSPITTLGGGRVIDPVAAKKRRHKSEIIKNLSLLSKSNLSQRLEYLIESENFAGLESSLLPVKCGEPLENIEKELETLRSQKIIYRFAVKDQNFYLGRESFQKAKELIQKQLEQFHLANPLQAGMPVEELRSRLGKKLQNWLIDGLFELLDKEGLLKFSHNEIALKEHNIKLSEVQAKAKSRIEKIILDSNYLPPAYEELLEILSQEGFKSKDSEDMYRLLIKEGLIIVIEEKKKIAFHKEIFQSMINDLRSYLLKHTQVTVQEFKEIHGLSRKYAVPFLEYCDRVNITVRQGDYRKLKC